MTENSTNNHQEAYELACLKQDHSNLARCYIQLFNFVEDDLSLISETLKNALEDINYGENSSLIIDVEKAINLTVNMTEMLRP
jgi:hypothetical protein